MVGFWMPPVSILIIELYETSASFDSLSWDNSLACLNFFMFLPILLSFAILVLWYYSGSVVYLHYWNDSIIIPWFSTCFQVQGSSLTFSAQGGRGKEKKIAPPKNFPSGARARRNSPHTPLPPRPSVGSPATCLNTWKAEHQRKMSFPFSEKIGARKIQNCRRKFCWGVAPPSAGRGGVRGCSGS